MSRQAQLDRTRVPSSGPIRHFEFPDVERRTLVNGLDLRVARLPRLPVVSVNLFMRAGEGTLPADRAGLAVLTGDALEGGTMRRNGSELADALERIGARLEVGSGWEGTSVTLSCLADHLPEALPLLTETVLEPGFPEDEVERTRSQHLAAIRQRAMDPSGLANDHAASRWYAPEVPYARPVDGTVESVTAVGRDDLLAYAGACYRPGQGGLIVAGDVDADEVERLALEHLGAWTGSPAADVDFAAEPFTRERRIWIVDRPGSVQSEIRVGHVGAARSTEDYFALSIANLVLGGTFTSRLNLNLRERNGFTYGVRSRFTFRNRPGPFYVSTAVGNEVTAAAVGEILKELEALVDEGPAQEEVEAARDFAAGTFGLQLETAGQVATRVTQLVVYGLPDRYYHEYRDNMRAVESDAAAAAARRHIRPSEAQVVLVADAEAVGASLEALGAGPVEVVRPA